MYTHPKLPQKPLFQLLKQVSPSQEFVTSAGTTLGFASAIDLAVDMGGSDMIQRILADHARVSAASIEDAESGGSGENPGKAQVAVS